MDELTIGDKIYISSKKAAEITGYAKDYIGQLCREGRVEATLVGRSWYVLESSLREHRFGKEKGEVTQEVGEERDSNAWVETKYVAEEVAPIPELRRVEPSVSTQETTRGSEVGSGVADMQAVWKEWFERRGTEEIRSVPIEEAAPQEVGRPYVSTTPNIEPQQEESAPTVRVSRKEAPKMTYVEDLRRIPMEAEEHSQPEPPRRRRQYVRESVGGGDIVLKAIIIGITIVLVSIAGIASGVSSSEQSSGPLSGLLNYLQGTNTIDK